MSYESFLRSKGIQITRSKREEAFYFINHHGLQRHYSDWWVWRTPARDAFWNAFHFTTVASDATLGLKERCRAVRAARAQWSLFLSVVVPWEPTVPPLPSP